MSGPASLCVSRGQGVRISQSLWQPAQAGLLDSGSSQRTRTQGASVWGLPSQGAPQAPRAPGLPEAGLEPSGDRAGVQGDTSGRAVGPWAGRPGFLSGKTPGTDGALLGAREDPSHALRGGEHSSTHPHVPAPTAAPAVPRGSHRPARPAVPDTRPCGCQARGGGCQCFATKLERPS